MAVTPVDEVVKKRLRALARAHDAFVVANLDAPFHPEGRSPQSDYNQHSVDLEAPPEAQRDFSQLGLAIMRGDHDDEL